MDEKRAGVEVGDSHMALCNRRQRNLKTSGEIQKNKEHPEKGE